MLLTAQRVRSPAGDEGINAFCSLHGPYVWDGEPPPGIPDSNPGDRANAHVAVPPGGNLVRSYLDVVAPDEAPTWEILSAVRPFLLAVRGRRLPWSATVGRCTFRFAIEPALAGSWAAELRALLSAAARVRVAV